MRLTYIEHSGFAIESSNYTIILDYNQDSINKERGVVHDRLLYAPQKLYVMCTHSHSDHYNPEILNWKEMRSDIVYIFSKDIEPVAPKFLGINFLDKGDVFRDDLIEVTAYGSTDIGVSFKIKDGEHILFHAGDLNNWHWNEESTDGEIKEATDYYARELDYLSKSTPRLDLAMFPVDPRLGKDYMLGAEQFLDRIPTKLFVPMHFDDAYEKASEIVKYAERVNTKVYVPSYKGEILDDLETLFDN